jgi:hypothetical protein
VGSSELRFVVKAKDEASKVLRGVGGSMSALGKLTKVGMAIAAVGVMALMAAIGALVGFVIKAKGVYESWMGTVLSMHRLTGLAAGSSSKLAGQLQLSGVDAKSGATGIYMFEKALDKARQGTSKVLTGFQRLHLTLKDGEGHWKSVSTLVGEARDKLSGIKDAATRAGIAALLFGKGAKTMLPWLIKSASTMKEYAGWLKEAGLQMGTKSLAQFHQYTEEQKHMSLLWQGFQVNAYRALVPLIGQIMPHLISIMKDAAGWMKKFADEASKKGILQSARDMVPGFKSIEKAARTAYGYIKDNLPKAFAWWKSNWPGIKSGLVAVGKAFGAIGKAVGDVTGWMKHNPAAVKAIRIAFAAMNPMLSYAQFAFQHIGQFISIIISVGKKVVGVIKSIASVVKTVTSGGFGALSSALSTIAGAARNVLALLDKIAHQKGNMSPGGGGGGGGGGQGAGTATGGWTTGPMSGYQALMHGTEFHIPANGNQITPNRVVGYGGGGSASPGLGGGDIHIHVHVPGGTTLIGEAERVGQILAPHVSRALAQSAMRAGRRR